MNITITLTETQYARYVEAIKVVSNIEGTPTDADLTALLLRDISAIVYQAEVVDGTTPKAGWAFFDPATPPTEAELANKRMLDVQTAVQRRLDDFAATREYDGILSACTYVPSTDAKFAGEGQYCVNARDAHWAKCYEIMGAYQAGLRPLPTVEEALAEMPALAWPA